MQYYEQTRNLVSRSKEFSNYLNNCQNQLNDQSKQAMAKKVTGYLAFHHNQLEQALQKIGQESANKVLDIWFKYIPEGTTCKCFDIIHVYPQMSPDEAADITMEIDECLLELYDEIAHNWDNPSVKDAFGLLFGHIKAEKRKIFPESSLLQY